MLDQTPMSSAIYEFVYGPVGDAGTVTLSGRQTGFFSARVTVGFRNTPTGTDICTEDFTITSACANHTTSASIAVGQYLHVSKAATSSRVEFDLACVARRYPLPVELTAFFVTASNGIAKLRWTTATEVNNYGFEIQKRRGVNGTWVPIGFVPGAGESASPLHYTFDDDKVSTATTYYRLLQKDRDGASTYS
ncbi:MAG: hypothetical protein C0600_06315, partial [Ignavibacteria bacterium]